MSKVPKKNISIRFLNLYQKKKIVELYNSYRKINHPCLLKIKSFSYNRDCFTYEVPDYDKYELLVDYLKKNPTEITKYFEKLFHFCRFLEYYNFSLGFITVSSIRIKENKEIVILPLFDFFFKEHLYKAPELQKQKIHSWKSDLYSFSLIISRFKNEFNVKIDPHIDTLINRFISTDADKRILTTNDFFPHLIKTDNLEPLTKSISYRSFMDFHSRVCDMYYYTRINIFITYQILLTRIKNLGKITDLRYLSCLNEEVLPAGKVSLDYSGFKEKLFATDYLKLKKGFLVDYKAYKSDFEKWQITDFKEKLHLITYNIHLYLGVNLEFALWFYNHLFFRNVKVADFFWKEYSLKHEKVWTNEQKADITLYFKFLYFEENHKKNIDLIDLDKSLMLTPLQKQKLKIYNELEELARTLKLKAIYEFYNKYQSLFDFNAKMVTLAILERASYFSNKQIDLKFLEDFVRSGICDYSPDQYLFIMSRVTLYFKTNQAFIEYLIMLAIKYENITQLTKIFYNYLQLPRYEYKPRNIVSVAMLDLLNLDQISTGLRYAASILRIRFLLEQCLFSKAKSFIYHISKDCTFSHIKEFILYVKVYMGLLNSEDPFKNESIQNSYKDILPADRSYFAIDPFDIKGLLIFETEFNRIRIPDQIKHLIKNSQNKYSNYKYYSKLFESYKKKDIEKLKKTISDHYVLRKPRISVKIAYFPTGVMFFLLGMIYLENNERDKALNNFFSAKKYFEYCNLPGKLSRVQSEINKIIY